MASNPSPSPRIRIRWADTLTVACTLALMAGIHIGAWLAA